MKREITCTQRLASVIGARVTGTGTAAINAGSTELTLTDNGTGDYTLTFVKPFARVPIVTVGVLTSNAIHQISSVSATAVRILGFQGTDGTTAKDIVFHVMILGFDSADET